jgi:hypothetical protein
MKNNKYTTFVVECDWTETVKIENDRFSTYFDKATEAMTRALERKAKKYRSGDSGISFSQFITAIDIKKADLEDEAKWQYMIVNLTNNVLINAGQPNLAKEVSEHFECK